MWNGANGTIEVDDSGGYEAYNTVYWDGPYHVSTIALAVYDSISEDLDNVRSYEYKGVAGDDLDDILGQRPERDPGVCLACRRDAGLCRRCWRPTTEA